MKSHNIWDEEYLKDKDYGADGIVESSPGYISSKNMVSVTPASKIYFKTTSYPQFVYEFDSSGTFIRRQQGSNTGTLYSLTDNTCFIHFSVSAYFAGGNTTYNNDICINLSSEFNGKYEPHGILTMTGGLKSAGSVYDEIKDGKYVKRVGEVDMGTLN